MEELMDFYIQKLEELYSEHAETEYAKWSKKYMRNQFDFLGIRTPIRRKLTKQFLKEYGLPSKEDLEIGNSYIMGKARTRIPKSCP